MIQIIPNFFSNFEYIKESFKKIPLYNNEEFNIKFNQKDTWPGFRSSELTESGKFLTLFFYEKLKSLNIKKNLMTDYTLGLYTHLRLEKDNDKDWIHIDNCEYAAIVYLSETNINSGTFFYNDKKEIIHKVGFVQNTCLFFNGNFPHKSGLNYGNDINDGRLTLNAFFYKKKC